MFGLAAQVIVVDLLARLALALKTQDGGPGRGVRWRDKQDAIETSRPAESGIEMPGGVRCGEDEHAFIRGLHAVHFGEELVDELPSGMMAHVTAARPESVHLIEEQHAGFVIARLFEEAVEVALAVPDPHV